MEWLRFSREYRFTKHHVGRRKDHIKNLVEVPVGSTSADLIVAASEVEGGGNGRRGQGL